jgi:hypothetical protein
MPAGQLAEDQFAECLVVNLSDLQLPQRLTLLIHRLQRQSDIAIILSTTVRCVLSGDSGVVGVNSLSWNWTTERGWRSLPGCSIRPAAYSCSTKHDHVWDFPGYANCDDW